MTEHEIEKNIRSDDAKARRVLEERWLKENATAIAEYNERIERNGVFGASKRRF